MEEYYHSGLKIDVIIRKRDAFDDPLVPTLSVGTRGIRSIRPIEDTEANFASPEDVIIKKMEYYKKGGSEKHLRDITGILKVSGEMIDYDYINQWSVRSGLKDIWESVLTRLINKA